MAEAEALPGSAKTLITSVQLSRLIAGCQGLPTPSTVLCCYAKLRRHSERVLAWPCKIWYSETITIRSYPVTDTPSGTSKEKSPLINFQDR